MPDRLATLSMPAMSKEGVDLSDPQFYINRELSLLRFHGRVLEEASDSSVPLMERIKFLAIVSNNLDEFFMTRVAGLWEQVRAGTSDLPADGITPQEQLDAIRGLVLSMMQQQRQIYSDLLPFLSEHGIYLPNVADLPHDYQTAVNHYFTREIFPVLTPLGVDPGRPFPFISNLSLNLAIGLETPDGRPRFARVKMPIGVLPRFISLRTIMEQVNRGETLNGRYADLNNTFLYLEDMIAANLPALFPGMVIKEHAVFRVTRNADFDIAEEEASDLLETIESSLQLRRFGMITRVTVEQDMSESLRRQLIDNLNISRTSVFDIPFPLGMADLFSLYAQVDAPSLRDQPFVPRRPRSLSAGSDIFAAIRERDILLYHPYDSFLPVVDFIEAAARDPQVLAIKCTLYRLGSKSPIVPALLEARQQGKQVAALVELKARFDEENNITWARAMEAEGVHVIYGFQGLKTHSKVMLVVRKESDGLRRYIHLSTGNYNATTARLYTDLALLTCREDLADDATQLFNRLTGFAPGAHYSKLMVAPEYFRKQFTALIEREIGHARAGQPARLVFKMNALVDPRMIRKLYEASMAGVEVELIVRGVCCLRPGIPGVSERIRVRSIVGRFLEHARVYYFFNGGNEEIYLGSADLMGRNLDRRVETVFPIESAALKADIRDIILGKQLEDNLKARVLQADGTYWRIRPQEDETPLDSQQWFVEQGKNPF